ncbi:MAG: isopenicillin N synthase family oxygenase [Pseudonocardia sp.]|nr:isopenicillin N synthase family oxygenase [Pseudonocardia sp.]
MDAADAADPDDHEPIRTVDLARRRSHEGPGQLVADVDASLREAGFLQVTGHGVDPGLRAEVRRTAREFFALSKPVKERYAVRIGGRGWLPPGVEANGNVEGEPTPPDLKESFAVGADTPVGDPAVDDVWFPPNVWPAEVPALGDAVREYAAHMSRLTGELLALCACVLGQPATTFDPLTRNPTWTFNINRYPPLTEVGEPAPGQFRIGAHADFGTVTVLDREPGAGGLQVHTDERGWRDAPYDPQALTVNIGDLLAHWTGLRWRSGRHRVLPPQPGSPTEELVSLVWFAELDHDALVTPLAPPVGARADLGPVVSAPFLKERLDAISVGG